jgi:hypothetical protein
MRFIVFSSQLLYLLTLSPASQAMVSCYKNAVFRDYEDVSSYIHNIASYDGVDNRMTVEAFADSQHMSREEVDAKLSATGTIRCGTFSGTAQLTYKSNIITTAGHLLVDYDDCKNPRHASDCTFTYKFNGQEATIKVERLVASGIKCPNSSRAWDDWAVMKLKGPARGPIPYGINPNKILQLKNNQNVIAVAAQSIDFCLRDQRTGNCLKDPKTHQFVRPKNVQYCNTRHVYYKDDPKDDPYYFTSDCASSNGASGGSVLDENLGRPQLLGIIVGDQESLIEAQVERMGGKVADKPYDDHKWAAFQVPVVGEFQAAILQAGD